MHLSCSPHARKQGVSPRGRHTMHMLRVHHISHTTFKSRFRMSVCQWKTAVGPVRDVVCAAILTLMGRIAMVIAVMTMMVGKWMMRHWMRCWLTIAQEDGEIVLPGSNRRHGPSVQGRGCFLRRHLPNHAHLQQRACPGQ